MHRPSIISSPAVKSRTGKRAAAYPSPLTYSSSLSHTVSSLASPRGPSYHTRPASSLVSTHILYGPLSGFTRPGSSTRIHHGSWVAAPIACTSIMPPPPHSILRRCTTAVQTVSLAFTDTPHPLPHISAPLALAASFPCIPASTRPYSNCLLCLLLGIVRLLRSSTIALAASDIPSDCIIVYHSFLSSVDIGCIVSLRPSSLTVFLCSGSICAHPRSRTFYLT
ncbi:hypothetical protein BD309DRAFT_82132 [Dichomitus squalens]|uniref:Uncharacterized protein n=1 Tax=Dichomitus squalens TaxID=114155 RepID=A0A4Q9NW04_9APHY|nr:hypothetical protein BD309DRAFT_82132 [Dichomitus squalens]TBU57064.1 hypothetical protein BD310DRAFT_573492 [Dichomitus squalens]